jgi:hypothetical protein
MSDSASWVALTLAAKVNHLFQTIHSDGRGEYTFEEVSEAIRQSYLTR